MAMFGGLSNVAMTFTVHADERIHEVAKSLSVRIDPPSAETIDQHARALSLVYLDAMTALARRACTLPPAAGIAGIAGVMTSVDATRGVWKAPANLSLEAVRTLDGNSPDWRYLRVLWTMFMIEESVTQALGRVSVSRRTSVRLGPPCGRRSKPSCKPCGVRTNSVVPCRMSRLLYVWGLVRPWTQHDIDQGRLIVEIGVAPVWPAEFGIVRIEHRMIAP